jgi:hypothetical protein
LLIHKNTENTEVGKKEKRRKGDLYGTRCDIAY